jgi:predicted transcriptional regulator
MFKCILEANRHGDVITTKQLADELDVTRGTVNHHLRDFVKAGILTREKRTIRLRANSLERTIREVKRDADRIFEDLERMAEELDDLRRH